MRYDHRVSIDLMLEDSAQYSLHQLKNKISKMRYTGGATVTQLALKEVKEKIFNGPPRYGVPRTCILLTDGKTFLGRTQVIQPANELRVFKSEICKNFFSFQYYKLCVRLFEISLTVRDYVAQCLDFNCNKSN